MGCHTQNIRPLYFGSPGPKFWTPGTKMFEIFGPPLKYSIPLYKTLFPHGGPNISPVAIRNGELNISSEIFGPLHARRQCLHKDVLM